MIGSDYCIYRKITFQTLGTPYTVLKIPMLWATLGRSAMAHDVVLPLLQQHHPIPWQTPEQDIQE